MLEIESFETTNMIPAYCMSLPKLNTFYNIPNPSYMLSHNRINERKSHNHLQTSDIT